MAKPPIVAQVTDPGFSSATTVLVAMAILYVIVSGVGPKLAAAWQTFTASGPQGPGDVFGTSGWPKWAVPWRQ